ncbi:NlpC/P60 family protein [Paenibacillus sp. GD4]|uniref:C40 family peptidase n=1 Tax=Paenibacillus sp. GD4 TaxID=3068890 RepID=UPI00279645E7|nr:NlpC/P60 family protein [Paenibacillus sp. GD4]MDQ1912576.1 NlpC/P60 family protein [Paenibacillus sp. GD4]
MRKHTTIILLLSLTLLSSCGAADTAVDDPDLYFGDIGVERQLLTYRVKSFVTQGKDANPLLDPNGFPLIKQLPNPAIRPIRGSYVENAIQTARSYMGTPYEYGSDRREPSTFDCSDFTRWVLLSSLGMDLPWDARSQAAYVKAFAPKTYTSLRRARRGDLLFFTSYRGEDPASYKGLKPSEKPITHMAIYMGNGKIIHSASKKSGGVRIDKITWRQLNHRFLFGGGIIPGTQT